MNTPNRRTFLGILGAAFGWLLTPTKGESFDAVNEVLVEIQNTTPPQPPTMEFNQEGIMTNAEELLQGIPFVQYQPCQGGLNAAYWKVMGWTRQRIVWVNEADAIQYLEPATRRGYTNSDELRIRHWGEMILVETIDKDFPIREVPEKLDPDMLVLSVWKLHPTVNSKARVACNYSNAYWGKRPYLNELPL